MSTQTLPDTDLRTKKLPPYNVILINDEFHSFDYVIKMVRQLFGYQEEKGFQIAKEVDSQGRAIVCTTSKERAELKQEQIHAFGPDKLVAGCVGSMWADIEPAV